MLLRIMIICSNRERDCNIFASIDAELGENGGSKKKTII